MKEDFFKHSNNYSVSVIGELGKKELDCDHSVITLNCKVFNELEFDNINVKKETVQDRKVNNLEVSEIHNEGSDFEAAIKATEFGKYNWLILFSAFWGYMSCMYATTSISLILPSAECDLNLSNFDKGLLNSFIYIGMVVSAFFWGCISDAAGRRNILMLAFALDSFFSVSVGLVQNFSLILTVKLFAGFISSGPIAILSSFLAENHSTAYRATVIICSGVFTSTASITLPFLAWLIIPLKLHISLFNGYILLPSWRIFLIVAAIPSTVAFICLFFLDESPKFLMFKGKNEEALKVFKRIYSLNTNKSKDTYPIHHLKNEMGSSQNEDIKNKSFLTQIITAALNQMIPLFKKPYIFKALLPCVMQFCTLLCVNTVRLWSPQLFALAIEKEKSGYNLTTAFTVCELLVPGNQTEQNEISRCGHVVADQVYFFAMITGVVTGIGYLISGSLAKTLEKKWLMVGAYLLSICCCAGLYWSTTSKYMLGVISVFIAFTSTSATALISAVVDIFPTSLRTSAVSLCLTFGRIGALVGNTVFPILLDWYCTSPFILLSAVLSFAVGLTLFLPNTKGKHLE